MKITIMCMFLILSMCLKQRNGREGRRSKAGGRAGLDCSAVLSCVLGIFNSFNSSVAKFSLCNWWKPLVPVAVSGDKVMHSLLVRHGHFHHGCHCALPKCGWRELGRESWCLTLLRFGLPGSVTRWSHCLLLDRQY